MGGGEGFLVRLETGFQFSFFRPSAIHLALSALAALVIAFLAAATATSSPLALCVALSSIRDMVEGDIQGLLGLLGSLSVAACSA
eukprot:9629011-Alexandrium_andersonii.AAC.1